jgi:Toxin co-regulated pilus biosynthesis protein Q
MNARSLSYSFSLAALLVTGGAQAEIVWKNLDAQSKAPIPSVTSASATPADGTPVPADRLVHGFGNGVTLDMALLQIIPEQVKVRLDPSVDRNIIISWEGGRPWTRVIADAVASFGIRTEYKSNTLEITRVRPPQTQPMPPASTTSSVAGNASIPPRALVAEQVVSPPAIGVSGASSSILATASLAGDAMRVWSVRQNSSLRQTIEDWSRMAGWNVPDWRANVDWRLNAGHAFSGEFEKAGVDLFTHFVQRFEQSDPPLAVCFFRANKVVVVGPQREIQPACQGQVQQAQIPGRGR